MKIDETAATRETRFCAYCGHPVPADQPRIERFGQPFCSHVHAEDFTSGVRNARMTEAAAKPLASTPPAAATCSMPPAGQRTWSDYLKRGACWGAPLLLLLALPLLWSGNSIAAAGGSLLSLAALLACPIGMFFMMRAMTSMNRSQHVPKADEDARKTTQKTTQ
jgi:hypothetical protein